MKSMTRGISWFIAPGLGALAACGTAHPNEMTNQRATPDAADSTPHGEEVEKAKAKREAAKRTKGQLALTLPAPLPGTDTKSVVLHLENFTGVCSNGSEVTYGGPLDGDVAILPPDEGCQSSSRDVKEDYVEGKTITIGDLDPGNYFVTAQVFAGEGALIEEGRSWMGIEAGQTTELTIVLQLVSSGNGSAEIRLEHDGDGFEGKCGVEGTVPEPWPTGTDEARRPPDYL